MGLFDLFQKTWKTLRTAIKTLIDLNRTFEALVSRIHQGASLPCPGPTTSYWLENPPFPKLVGIQSDQLSTKTDIVVIGSGITGAAISRTLLQQTNRDNHTINITVLEARDICSGATGRNGGHVKVAPYEAFEALERKFGEERAVALTRFQLRHLEVLREVCESEGVEGAECRGVETVDLFLDDEVFEGACRVVERMGWLLPECEIKVFQASEAREKFSTSNTVVGALSYEAGAIWPYRFVTSIWNTLLQEYPNQLTIETNTPVVSVEKESAGNAYNVYTNRGIIHCTHVVHATNAWMSHLLPSFKTKATGVRAHMSAQNPGYHSYQTFHGDRSWSIIYGENDYDYMTQRPSAKGMGDIMLGGGTFRSKDNGINQIGVWDDSCTDALTSAHLAGILPIVFSPDKEARKPEQHERFLQQHWSGIIALTADSLPFVGRLDGRLSGRKSQQCSADSSEWISAGYNGQGMVFAWLCGTALAVMIMGLEEESIPASPGYPGGILSEWFPKELLLDDKRFDRIDILDLADQL
ncbi:nucleotide-binding domain-containing protein [Aureobasidium pullulans]|nr:nucleotide-binding domain-containing protein [Aureobasidium pullulans]